MRSTNSKALGSPVSHSEKTSATTVQLRDALFKIDSSLLTEPPHPTHVLPGLLEGTAGLLAAPGGIGKTMLLIQTGIAMAAGLPICGGLFDNVPAECARRKQPSKVVLLLAEEGSRIVGLRLHAALKGLTEGGSPLLPHSRDSELIELLQENLVILNCADVGRPTLIGRDGQVTPAYRQLREIAEGAQLVMLDPLRQLHSGDEVDSGYMTDVMGHLQRIVAGTNGALLVSHHTSQASSVSNYGDRAQAARGSTAITDAVRLQINLSAPTVEWLTRSGVSFDEVEKLLRVDVAKANYLPQMRTQLLLRGPGGVLRQPRANELRWNVNSGSRSRRQGAW